MKHGTQRNHRMHSEVEATEHAVFGYEETRCEKWCAHCRIWVPVHGVTGAIQFMAQHEEGDCMKGVTPKEGKER